MENKTRENFILAFSKTQGREPTIKELSAAGFDEYIFPKNENINQSLGRVIKKKVIINQPGLKVVEITRKNKTS